MPLDEFAAQSAKEEAYTGMFMSCHLFKSWPALEDAVAQIPEERHMVSQQCHPDRYKDDALQNGKKKPQDTENNKGPADNLGYQAFNFVMRQEVFQMLA